MVPCVKAWLLTGAASCSGSGSRPQADANMASVMMSVIRIVLALVNNTVYKHSIMQLILRHNYSAKICSWGSSELICVIWRAFPKTGFFMILTAFQSNDAQHQKYPYLV